MKNYFKRGSLLLLAVFLLTACGKGPENVVAEVNGEPIYRDQFDTEYAYMRHYTVQSMGEDYLEVVNEQGIANKYSIAKQVLDNLVFRKVLEEDAAKLGVEVTEEEVNKELEEIKTQLNTESEGNGYQEYLDNNAMSEDFLKENIRLQLLLNQYETKRLEQVEISDKEIQKYYDEHKDQLVQVDMSAILVNSTEEAETVKEKIDAGEDFESLAKDYSIDHRTAVEGGKFGFVYRGMLPTDIEDVIFAMEENTVSEPFVSENGVYIFKVGERKEALEELKDLIDPILRRQKYDNETFALRKDAKVKEYLDYKTVE